MKAPQRRRPARASGRRLFVLAAALVVVSLAGCGTPPRDEPQDGATTAAGSGLALEDQVAIYQAVVRRVCGPDDTFGGQLSPPVIFIVGVTDDSAADPQLAEGATQVLSPALRSGIAAGLTDLDAEVVWVEAFEEVRRDQETGLVERDGVIVTLGNLNVDRAGIVRVAASIYIANLAAGGTTYVLEGGGGSWTITGTTGGQWIS